MVEGTRPRTVNSIGMFDLLKGAGMLAIVLAHTAELYPLEVSGGLSLTAFFPFIYRESLMAAFFIASGYGFRKRSLKKCIHQQLSSLLKPYCWTAFFTCVLHFIIHYKTFGYLPGTVGEAVKVLGGFLLGLPHTASYFGQEFFSCGPMWYLLALLVGWILLDLILNIFPESYINWAVIGTALLGWGTSLAWELPFCITQGMVIVPYLYLGFLAKKNHWLDQPLSRRMLLLLWASVVLIAVGALATQRTDCVSLAQWSLGPVSIFLDGAAGLLFIRLFLRWNQHSGRIVHALEAVGRRSLHIFCVHTVELIAVPWYLFAAKFADRPMLGLWLQYLISILSIALICALLQLRREISIRLFSARRKKERNVYTPQH